MAVDGSSTISYNGSVISTYTSLPFGDGQTSSGSDADPYHYAQLDFDAETGTDHAQFRQLSTAQGRWMRPDPDLGSYDQANPQSLNRYAYALNNPLSYTDSEGLQVKAPTCGNNYPGGTDGNNPLDPSGDGSVWSASINGLIVQETMSTYATFSDGSFSSPWVPIPGMDGETSSNILLEEQTWVAGYLGAGAPGGASGFGQGGSQLGRSPVAANDPLTWSR